MSGAIHFWLFLKEVETCSDDVNFVIFIHIQDDSCNEMSLLFNPQHNCGQALSDIVLKLCSICLNIMHFMSHGYTYYYTAVT